MRQVFIVRDANSRIRTRWVVLAIVSSSTDCYIRVWDVQSGEQITTIDAGPMDAWLVRFSPDGHRVVTGSRLIRFQFTRSIRYKLQAVKEARSVFIMWKRAN